METAKKERFVKEIRERNDELFRKLGDLIRINSENFGATGNEKEIAYFLGEAFGALGCKTEVYSPLEIEGITEHPDYYPGRGLENRFNMTAILPGSDHSKRLMMAAHLDTETIGELSTWTVDPLGGEVHDGRVWGRGACDDKYGIAAVWHLMQLLRDEGIVLPFDFIFTAYCDEEKGGGNGSLAACLKYPVDDVLNLDCKDRQIVASGAGGGCMKATIATKEPVDNCEVLLDGIAVYREVIDKFRQRRHDELMQYPRFANSIIPDTAVRFQSIRVGADLSLNRTQVGICFYTSRTEEEIYRELDEMAKELSEKLEPLGMVFEGFKITTRFFRFAEAAYDNPTMELLKRSVKKVTGEDQDGIAMCLSDHPIYVNWASPRALSFGGGREFGEYGGAHQPDEFIECENFTVFAEILGEFLMNYGDLY